MGFLNVSGNEDEHVSGNIERRRAPFGNGPDLSGAQGRVS